MEETKSVPRLIYSVNYFSIINLLSNNQEISYRTLSHPLYSEFERKNLLPREKISSEHVGFHNLSTPFQPRIGEFIVHEIAHKLITLNKMNFLNYSFGNLCARDTFIVDFWWERLNLVCILHCYPIRTNIFPWVCWCTGRKPPSVCSMYMWWKASCNKITLSIVSSRKT